jgi:hypothetical protein
VRNILVSTLLLCLMALAPMKNVSAQYIDPADANNAFYSNEFYVAAKSGLKVRSTPEDAGKVMGLLALNEKVRVLSPELLNGKYVEIEVLGKHDLLPSERYYVVQEFLSEKPMDFKEFTGKYFVVVNVATETLRLYERQCMDNSCPNKMIMETEVVVGEDRDHALADKGKGRSIVGSYRVTGWAKFYQDAEGHYPAWYKDGYPNPPSIGNNNWKDWFKNRYMPPGVDGEKDGKMRGAFGWYTAFVAPNPFGQWTHGTVGWGENKDEYIKKTKKFLINLVSNPRSSGCTRNNNEAIAFLRQIVETGTPIIKIYAREALLDPALSNYREESRTWKYILTKKAGQRAEREEVLKSLGLTSEEVDAFWRLKRSGGEGLIDPQSPLNQILEVGSYNLDTQPSVIGFTPRKKFGKLRRTVGRNGNVYGVKNDDMSSGVYYIDAGFLNGYHHPRAIVESSGFMDEETPPWMDIHLLNRY